MRRLALAVVVLAHAAPAQAALPRATADRPDDVAGPQVHVVYALPADGADRELDTNGRIEASVAAFQGWLARETGGATLRMDTAGGALDVTFARLARSDAEIAARGAFVREEVEAGLAAAGLAAEGKVYAVYYDGSSTHSCGGAFWPPQIDGRVVAMYLRGAPPGWPPCDGNPLGVGAGYWEFAMLHDLLHGLGYVGTCAPHHTRAGHVSDADDDLMYAGDAPWRLPPRLDVGRDDYYGHGRADCPDLANSPYLVRAPAATPAVKAGRAVVGRATAGRPFTVRLRVLVDGAPAAGARTSCRATLSGRRLPGRASFAAGRAVCRWTLPWNARGKRIRGTVRVDVPGAAAVSRRFSALVRG